MSERLLLEWVRMILGEQKIKNPRKKDLSAKLLERIKNLNLPSEFPEIPWDDTPVNLTAGSSPNIRFRIAASRANRENYAKEIMEFIRNNASALELHPESIKNEPEEVTYSGKFIENPRLNLKFVIKPAGRFDPDGLGKLYEHNVSDLFNLILSLANIPDGALKFDVAGSTAGSDIQITARTSDKPLFKMEVKNTVTPELGSSGFKYNVSTNKYEAAGDALKHMKKNPAKKEMWDDVLEVANVGAMKLLDTATREDIINSVYQRLDTPVPDNAEQLVFNYNTSGDSILGPNVKHKDSNTKTIIKDEFQKVVFSGKKGTTAAVDPNVVANYYTSKDDDFIHVAEKGLYSLKDDWQKDIAPSFKDSLTLPPKALRLRLRPSNSTFRAAFMATGNWIRGSEVKLTSPSQIRPGELGDEAFSLDKWEGDAAIVAQILSAALGLNIDDVLEKVEHSLTPTPQLISQHGDQQYDSWPPSDDTGRRRQERGYSDLGGNWEETTQKKKMYTNDGRVRKLGILRHLIRESILTEELTRTDKREIERIARKQAQKEITRVVGRDLDETIRKAVEKVMKDKATKDEMAKISKAVLQKLYKELARSYPQAIDRIKL